MKLDKKKYEDVFAYFAKENPNPKTELNYSNPFELLVAVVLSAQCTDKRVNEITQTLFKRYKSPEDLAASSVDEIFHYIRSCSYPNNKAKHLFGLGQMMVNKFDSAVPDSVDALIKLPGVGRKTANVITSVIFNQPSMAVDTHVFRVSDRLGLTKNAKNPLEAEKQLVSCIPDDVIPDAHHWLILHGRYICKARKPNCHECGITAFCDFFKNN